MDKEINSDKIKLRNSFNLYLGPIISFLIGFIFISISIAIIYITPITSNQFIYNMITSISSITGILMLLLSILLLLFMLY